MMMMMKMMMMVEDGYKGQYLITVPKQDSQWPQLSQHSLILMNVR